MTARRPIPLPSTTVRSSYEPADLVPADLHSSLTDHTLESMTFLNEIADRFPHAISLAAGRPNEESFDVEALHRYLRRYEQYLMEDRGLTPREVRRTLFQYGRTKGIIHELVARNLEIDEGICVDPESIVVTVGCQEALTLVLRALRTSERDCVLALAPTYVGMTGAARLVELPVLPVRGNEHGIDLDDLVAVVRQARMRGLRPRACYLVPDFSNPTGSRLSLATRHALLDLAEREGLLLLEDNPYGMFTAHSAERMPTLKSLDTTRRVVYLGSFAKTGLPGARVGYAVADQRVDCAGLFADELAKVKSMLTVNTSALSQAVIAGKLLEHDCSLVKANEREAAAYRDNLRQLLTALTRHFPPGSGTGVTWNSPNGGFFLVLDVPFRADDHLLERSAREYGVLWTPMTHFHHSPQAAHQMRLCYSLPTPAELDEGVERLAALIRDRLSEDRE